MFNGYHVDKSAVGLHKNLLNSIAICSISVHENVSGESFFNALSHLVSVVYDVDHFISFMQQDPDAFLTLIQSVDKIRQNLHLIYNKKTGHFIDQINTYDPTFISALEPIHSSLDWMTDGQKAQVLADANNAFVIKTTTELKKDLKTYRKAGDIIDFYKLKHNLVLK